MGTNKTYVVHKLTSYGQGGPPIGSRWQGSQLLWVMQESYQEQVLLLVLTRTRGPVQTSVTVGHQSKERTFRSVLTSMSCISWPDGMTDVQYR